MSKKKKADAKKSDPKTTELATVDQSGAVASSALLKSVMAGIHKKHGSDAIAVMGETGGLFKLPRQLSSGSLTLDFCLGPFHRTAEGLWQYGFAGGRMVEVYGPEAGGKTTLTLHIIAAAQKKGGTAAFVDAEHALDPNWARRIGVNLDTLLIAQPQYGEQALQITEDLLRSNALDVIVVDSIAALIPKSMLEGEIGDASMGKQAKMMSEALAKFTSIQTKTLLVFTNQLREKIGVMFGNPETTPGGRAMRFYASYRLDVRRGEPIKEGDVQIGHKQKVKLIKNKLAPPYQMAEFDFLYDLRPDLPAGIDKVAELFDIATTIGLIQNSGAYHYIGERMLGQGRRNAINGLRADKTLMWDLFNLTMQTKLAQRGYNPDLTPMEGMPAMPIVGEVFEPPTAEDLVNAVGQEVQLPEAA